MKNGKKWIFFHIFLSGLELLKFHLYSISLPLYMSHCLCRCAFWGSERWYWVKFWKNVKIEFLWFFLSGPEFLYFKLYSIPVAIYMSYCRCRCAFWGSEWCWLKKLGKNEKNQFLVFLPCMDLVWPVSHAI